MKMVKSLLLGSAAGLVAIAGAQAADLPVKAKAVEYVKVCSLYGAGFYYIPGTDICLKVGGFVRADIGWNNTGLTLGPFQGDFNTRVGANEYSQRMLYLASFDARASTAYGVVRGYMSVGGYNDINGATGLSNLVVSGLSNQSASLAPYTPRAFIQWAGFTIGQAQSFFDGMNYGAYEYAPNGWGSDTAASGWRVLAYTAQFGGGFSATLSLEEPRRNNIYNVTAAQFATAALLSAIPFGGGIVSNPEVRMPDIVGNLKVSQAWGDAQVMAAVHDASASYYAGGVTASANGAPLVALGNPSNALGWAVGAHLKINVPSLGAGDSLSLQAIWSSGAFRYASNYGGIAGAHFMYNGVDTAFGGRVGAGLNSDAIFINGGQVQLTTAWTLAAAYDHFWRPDLHTSLWANYLVVDYGAAANALLCSTLAGGQGGAGCNFDWSELHVGSRTQWDIRKDFHVGAEVVYSRLTSMKTATGVLTTPGGGGLAAGTYSIYNPESWSFRLRAQYNFVP